MWHIVLIAFLALGVFLGGIGSSFATKKYLKEFRPIKVVESKKGKKNKDKNKDESSKKEAKREKQRQKEEIKLKKENLKREAKEKQEQEKQSKQEFERKRKARRLSVLLLVLVLATPFTKIFAESTQDKINAIDKETSAAAKKYEQVQSDIKVYEADIKKLDSEVNKYTEEVNSLSSKVETAKKEVESISEKLQNVSTNYEATEQLLNTRLRVLYENGFVNMWEVLFSAESITDFLAKYNVLATLIESDKKNLEEMNDQKKYIQGLKYTEELKTLLILNENAKILELPLNLEEFGLYSLDEIIGRVWFGNEYYTEEFEIIIDTNHPNFVVEDNLVYNKDKSKLIMPLVKMDKIIINKNVKEISEEFMSFIKRMVN